jgi:hypothetical protein
MYPWYGGDDGGSQEGPRYYHDLGMIPGLNTLDVFRSAFGLRLEEGNPWFRANPYFLIYSFPPGSRQTQLGDANPGPNDPEVRPAPGGKARIAALRMAELHGNGHAAAYAAAVPEDDLAYTVSEYLRWSVPPKVAPIPLSSLPPTRLFADTGTVFLHSHLAEPQENVRLIFHASPYGGNGHAHADQNSFHVIAYNEHLLLDSGYYTPTGRPPPAGVVRANQGPLHAAWSTAPARPGAAPPATPRSVTLNSIRTGCTSWATPPRPTRRRVSIASTVMSSGCAARRCRRM